MLVSYPTLKLIARQKRRKERL